MAWQAQRHRIVYNGCAQTAPKACHQCLIPVDM
jgi:hypothetical protein